MSSRQRLLDLLGPDAVRVHGVRDVAHHRLDLHPVGALEQVRRSAARLSAFSSAMMSAPVAVSVICFLLGSTAKFTESITRAHLGESRSCRGLSARTGSRSTGRSVARARSSSWLPIPSFTRRSTTLSPPSSPPTTASSATTTAAPGSRRRQGPYDMDTGAADLAAVIEAAGEPAVIVGLGDAPQPRRSRLRRAARSRRGDGAPGRHARRTATRWRAPRRWPPPTRSWTPS